jgi:hypothetical protein
LISAIINTATDFLVVLLPLPTVFAMPDLDRRQKWSLCAIFSLSGLVCVAGVVRTVTLNIILHRTYDTTWEGWWAWIWTAAETYIGIICASIPALKPLFKRYFGTKYDTEMSEHRNRWHIKEVVAETPSTQNSPNQWIHHKDETASPSTESEGSILAMQHNHIVQRDFQEEREREQEHRLGIGSYSPSTNGMYGANSWGRSNHNYKGSGFSR